MKTAAFCASVAILAQAPIALAQGLRQATGGSPDATVVPWYPEPSEEVSECEAELITTLCDYKKPLYGTAVASSGKKNCWEYCNDNQPCSFVIFAAGNPYTGSGSCWLYPGEEFDESLGEPGCDYLSVYKKPVCTGSRATPTTGDACAATNSPSAVAEICGYPSPPDECFYTCSASSGASDCMSQCAEADSCSYAVFNPRNEMKSQYHSGTCWMYPEGKFDKSKAKTCKDGPEQFVYENKCPKPKPTSSASAPKGTSTSSGDNDDDESSNRSGSSDKSGDKESDKKGDNDDNDDSGSSNSPDDDAERDGATADEDQGEESGDDDNGSMMVGVSLTGTVAAGLAVLLWQGVQ